MPGPLLIAGIQAGTSLISSGINALTEGANNRDQRRFVNWMYDKQRGDALADYNMQNEYNSPTSQMARLKAGGLNPNLVYGNGATTTAAPVRSVSAGAYSPTAPKIDASGINNALSNYVGLKMQEQQIDNLKTQNTVAMQDAALKKAQEINTNMNTAATAQNTARSQFDLQLASELKNYSLEAAKLGVEKQSADIRYTLDNNDRQAAANAASVEEAVTRILKMRQETTTIPLQKEQIQNQIMNLQKDAELKQLDINLKRTGVQPGDPLIFRAAAQLLNDVGNPLKDKNFWDKTKSTQAAKGYGNQFGNYYKNNRH